MSITQSYRRGEERKERLDMIAKKREKKKREVKVSNKYFGRVEKRREDPSSADFWSFISEETVGLELLEYCPSVFQGTYFTEKENLFHSHPITLSFTHIVLKSLQSDHSDGGQT